MSGCADCRTLLSQGLDLCVRARKLDAQDRTNNAKAFSIDGEAWEKSGRLEQYAVRNNAINPDQPMALKSATPALWVLDQYERDLADWERQSRAHLMQGCPMTDGADK